MFYSQAAILPLGVGCAYAAAQYSTPCSQHNPTICTIQINFTPMHKSPIKILAISGSLRANSSNNAIIKAVAQMVPKNLQFTIYNDLALIPPFDDSHNIPLPVINFRHQLQTADGIFICTPEYAFGVSGVLKNALDWTVSSGELVNKPLALVTAATSGDKAHAALLLTFTALSSTIPPNGELLIPYVRSKLDAHGSISDPATAAQLQQVVNALVAGISANPA